MAKKSKPAMREHVTARVTFTLAGWADRDMMNLDDIHAMISGMLRAADFGEVRNDVQVADLVYPGGGNIEITLPHRVVRGSPGTAHRQRFEDLLGVLEEAAAAEDVMPYLERIQALADGMGLPEGFVTAMLLRMHEGVRQAFAEKRRERR